MIKKQKEIDSTENRLILNETECLCYNNVNTIYFISSYKLNLIVLDK